MFLILKAVIRRTFKVCHPVFFLFMTLLTAADFAVADEPVQIALPVIDMTAAPEISNIWLKMPIDEKIVFSGDINYDKAGIQNPNFLYPVPGLIGLLAAVATHGVVANAAKENQKQKLRDDANKVLQGYQPVLDDFKYPELVAAALGMMTATGKKRVIVDLNQTMPNDMIVESHPEFSITQDQRAIILNNTISIQTSGRPEPYRTQIHVVSRDMGQEAPDTAWTEDQGRKLKSESERLFAVSLDVALGAMGATGKEEGSYKTIRFQEGGEERMERGQLIREDCNNIVFKTLRGNLMSVPPKNGSCADIASHT
jgi:hypothetical protein